MCSFLFGIIIYFFFTIWLMYESWYTHFSLHNSIRKMDTLPLNLHNTNINMFTKYKQNEWI